MSDNTEVAEDEVVGRRLFGKDVWNGDKPEFNLSHFFDTRLQLDLSVDVLGRGDVERRRLRQLSSHADNEAQSRTPYTSFEGWAAILVRHMRFPGWVPKVKLVHDPTNVFHAEISRDGFREKRQAYAFATVMADRFSRRGKFVAPERKSAKVGK